MKLLFTTQSRAIEVTLGQVFAEYNITPLIRKLVIRSSNYPDRPGPSSKFVENSTELTYLETTSHRMKCCAVLWLIELQVSQGRRVWTEVPTVNSNS